MQTGVVAKAAPETATTTANATGILDLSLRSLSISEQQKSTTVAPLSRSAPRPSVHSYGIPPFQTD